jgi:hypothetical protein
MLTGIEPPPWWKIKQFWHDTLYDIPYPSDLRKPPKLPKSTKLVWKDVHLWGDIMRADWPGFYYPSISDEMWEYYRRDRRPAAEGCSRCRKQERGITQDGPALVGTAKPADETVGHPHTNEGQEFETTPILR